MLDVFQRARIICNTNNEAVEVTVKFPKSLQVMFQKLIQPCGTANFDSVWTESQPGLYGTVGP